MRTLAAVILIASTASGWAQAPSPAQMGISTTTVPQVLYVLDKTKAWVAIGTVDPVTHVFTPAGGVVSEAPLDGQQYGRQSVPPGTSPAQWTAITGGGPPTGGCNQLVFSVACNSQYVGAGVP
jgi:hypothetical protein